MPEAEDDIVELIRRNKEELEKLADEQPAERMRESTEPVEFLKRLYRKYFAKPEAVSL